MTRVQPGHLATLEDAVHLIQVALTPVFLLSGIAALLNVFASRLARVSDRLEALSTIEGETAQEQTRRLHRRLRVLDGAVVLGSIGAVATCLSILTLFVQALSNRVAASVLVGLFGLAIICTLASVAAFGAEMLISSRGVRVRLHLHAPWLHRRA